MDFYFSSDIPSQSVDISSCDGNVYAHFDAHVEDSLVTRVLAQLSTFFVNVTMCRQCGSVESANHDNTIVDEQLQQSQPLTFLRDRRAAFRALAQLSSHCCYMCHGHSSAGTSISAVLDRQKAPIGVKSARCRCCFDSSVSATTTKTMTTTATTTTTTTTMQCNERPTLHISKRCAANKYEQVYSRLAQRLAGEASEERSEAGERAAERCAMENCFEQRVVERRRRRLAHALVLTLALETRLDRRWLDALNARLVRASAGRRAVSLTRHSRLWSSATSSSSSASSSSSSSSSTSTSSSSPSIGAPRLASASLFSNFSLEPSTTPTTDDDSILKCNTHRCCCC
jgi:hypothetical protein